MTATADPILADLLRTVILEPDSDEVRLVYADRLEETGEVERAEFIRVQVALTVSRGRKDSLGRNIGHTNAERINLLMQRELTLLCSNFDRWHGLPEDPHGRLWDMANFDDSDPEPEAQRRALFVRGFVESVTLSADAWLANADALCAATPLREVRLTSRPKVRVSFASREQVSFRIADRPARTVEGADMPPTLLVRDLLTAEWPRIRFTLPERP